MERGATVKLQARGDVIATSNANFQVLHPKKTTGTIDNKNDHSLVLFVEIGGLTWLFTGDLEEEGERQLIGEYPTLEVDVLKAGHHGSRTSSTDAFIEHIKPSVAVITAGEDNRFNHPHADVVETLRRHNVQVVGTHENGAIRFIHDGHSWSVEVNISSVH
ncbi:ComEC/Rec2 family competence protein [Geomicrobium sp. JCM 19038]|uniref:ComEC/Rec2 family competence protein n=1 Tax=Geomicrobium sp. JCM 19038 TaxID=1460635 RepID=UPI0005AABCBA|nr:MBL fold metallo-hydrolase [Geomicrobium sp. JCM 19038]